MSNLAPAHVISYVIRVGGDVCVFPLHTTSMLYDEEVIPEIMISSLPAKQVTYISTMCINRVTRRLIEHLISAILRLLWKQRKCAHALIVFAIPVLF